MPFGILLPSGATMSAETDNSGFLASIVYFLQINM